MDNYSFWFKFLVGFFVGLLVGSIPVFYLLLSIIKSAHEKIASAEEEIDKLLGIF